MSDEIVLESFHGLKCSRPQCGGDAKIVEEWGEIIIRCSVCTNEETIYVDENYNINTSPDCSNCNVLGDANDILYGMDSDEIKIKDLKNLL
jgi:hypothetical protein